MKKQILIVLFLGFCFVHHAQEPKPNYPDFIGKDVGLVEKHPDWKILEKASGDLNKDGLLDAALLLESKDSILMKQCSQCFVLKNKPRILLVALNKNGSEKVIIQNNTFIALGNQGGMLPYLEPEISIDNGLLTIYYQYIRSNQSYTFEYTNHRMMIVKAESNDVHAASGDFENDSFDFIKGELTTITGNIAQDEMVTKIIKLDVRPKSLSEFKKMYDWEVTEDKFL